MFLGHQNFITASKMIPIMLPQILSTFSITKALLEMNYLIDHESKPTAEEFHSPIPISNCIKSSKPLDTSEVGVHICAFKKAIPSTLHSLEGLFALPVWITPHVAYEYNSIFPSLSKLRTLLVCHRQEYVYIRDGFKAALTGQRTCCR